MLDLPAVVDPDDALSQPTRAQLFGLLSGLRRRAGTAELAETLGLHPNGVRAHLERLERAGLVERARVPTRRGRPPDAWRISPGARPGGEKPQAYRDLGRWLARVLRQQSRGLRAVEATGREIGRELAPSGSDAGAAGLETTLTSLGFQPAVSARDENTITLCLGNCPYSEAVRENQSAICALHQGITRGLLDVLDPAATLASFVPHDPDQGGCVIEVHGLPEPALAE